MLALRDALSDRRQASIVKMAHRLFVDCANIVQGFHRFVNGRRSVTPIFFVHLFFTASKKDDSSRGEQQAMHWRRCMAVKSVYLPTKGTTISV